MIKDTKEKQGALILAGNIESAVNNPEKAVKRIDKKTDVKSALGTIIDFIKEYKKKGDQSDEAWLKQQFSKPEYAPAWKNKDTVSAVQALMQGVEDYENAKKSLRSHIELGGSRSSWLTEQIEIGAACNNKDPAEYKKEVFAGLNEARNENSEFLLDTTGLELEA